MGKSVTLEQELRCIDLRFECILEAEKRLIARGEISRLKPFQGELPSPRGKLINAASKPIMRECMIREGLPMHMLDGEAQEKAA